MKKIMFLFFLVSGVGSLTAMEGGEQAPTEKATEFDGVLPELMLSIINQTTEFDDVPLELILNIIDQAAGPLERMNMIRAFQYGLKGKINDQKRREEFHNKLLKIFREARNELDEQEAEQINIYALDFKFRVPIIYFEIKNETDQKVEVAGDRLHELQRGESVSFRKGPLDKKNIESGGGRIVEYANVTDNYNPLPNVNSIFKVLYQVGFLLKKDKITGALLEIFIKDKNGNDFKKELSFNGSLGQDDMKRFKVIITLNQDGTQSIDIVELK